MSFLAKEAAGNRLRGQPQLVMEYVDDPFSPPSSIRTPTDIQCEMMPHPHKDVLDCFSGANGCRDVHVQDHARTDENAFHVYPVRPDAKGLMNTFFEGCTGQAKLRVHKKNKEQFLSVDSHNAKPGPLVFKKTGQGWKVSLGGTNWWVDPSIITQAPELEMPFEWKKGRSIQRDWIPLRDAHGNTSILVLRKSPAMGDRYFMYQPGQEKGLIPRPIGTSDIPREWVEAQLLYVTALSGHSSLTGGSAHGSLESGDFQLQSLKADPMASLATQRDRIKVSNVDKDVIQITNMSRGWAKNADPVQLTAGYADIAAQSRQTQRLAPLNSQPLGVILDEMEVPPNELREIVREKRSKQKSIQTYSKPKFSTFSVGAGFDAASEKYFGELRKKSGNGDSPVVDTQHRQCQEYREGVFRELQVFKGCELDDEALPGCGRNDCVS